MCLLNLCCGATRPPPPWMNLDTLRSVLAPGTPERAHLERETNYVDFDVLSGPLPFPPETFDGILASHCVEHWTLNESVGVLRECHHILRPGGIIVVSVPNPSVFREHYGEDNPANAKRLFGEEIHPGDNERTFMGYALFNRFHKQALCEDALWCILTRAGFRPSVNGKLDSMYAKDKGESGDGTTLAHLCSQLNRFEFSCVMIATK